MIVVPETPDKAIERTCMDKVPAERAARASSSQRMRQRAAAQRQRQARVWPGWHRLGRSAIPIVMSTPIVGNAEIMGGTPCLAGARVPFQTLLDYLEGGDSLYEFLEDFPSVPREIAVAALQQAGDLAIANARVA
jgi:uncharacterized protein (DUF433 family)